jgi:cell division protein FtsW
MSRSASLHHSSVRAGAYPQVDFFVLSVVLALMLFGFCFIYTASAMRAERDFHDAAFFLKRQLLFAALALTVMFIVMRFDYRLLLPHAPVVYWVAVVLLCVVLFAPSSWIVRGSRRWLMFGSMQFQPSELAKYAMVFFFSHRLSQKEIDIHDFRNGLLPQLALLGAVAVAVALEPDLGTAALIAGVGLVLLFLAQARWSHMLLIGGAVAAALVPFLVRATYQRTRIISYVASVFGDAAPSWQVKQSLISLGDGGLFGVGLGQSRQRLFFLPDPHTDFILAIIGEELGLLGTLAILFLFIVFILRGFQIARRAPDRAGQLLAAGITLCIGLYAFTNAGVVLNLLPTTGVPMPFVSYGGSALLLNLFGVGVLLNIAAQGKKATVRPVSNFRNGQRFTRGY